MLIWKCPLQTLLSLLPVLLIHTTTSEVSLDIHSLSSISLPFSTVNRNFGAAVVEIGDIDGDGIIDLAVGAPSESTAINPTDSNGNTGAVYILFMSSPLTASDDNPSVRNSTRITDGISNGPNLSANSFFGSSITFYGERIIAVGAPGTVLGAVYILYLDANGTCNSTVLIRGRFIGNGAEQGGSDINNGTFNGPHLRYQSQFILY